MERFCHHLCSTCHKIINQRRLAMEGLHRGITQPLIHAQSLTANVRQLRTRNPGLQSQPGPFLPFRQLSQRWQELTLESTPSSSTKSCQLITSSYSASGDQGQEQHCMLNPKGPEANRNTGCSLLRLCSKFISKPFVWTAQRTIETTV